MDQTILAQLILGSGVLSLVFLLVLHFASPEFQPSWRMVSEYAMGKYKGLLTAFFVLWGTSALLLALLLAPLVSGLWAWLGVVLLCISGIGAIMGGLFDINHPWHGLSFALGVPTLPIAALLLSYHLVQNAAWQPHSTAILGSAHSVWLSLILMGVAMATMFSGFKKAGVSWEKDAPPPDKVPDGVVALGGYANRLLVVCYIGWLILMAKVFITIY